MCELELPFDAVTLAGIVGEAQLFGTVGVMVVSEPLLSATLGGVSTFDSSTAGATVSVIMTLILLLFGVPAASDFGGVGTVFN